MQGMGKGVLKLSSLGPQAKPGSRHGIRSHERPSYFLGLCGGPSEGWAGQPGFLLTLQRQGTQNASGLDGALHPPIQEFPIFISADGTNKEALSASERQPDLQ